MVDIKTDIAKAINISQSDIVTKKRFLDRFNCGLFTRDENPKSHFCLFFALFDSNSKQVFLGLHKKSNQWLFNGGHIDKGEVLTDSLTREVKEELGSGVNLNLNVSPKLLTIKKIEHPEKLICEYHYDIWYFIPVEKSKFNPDYKRLEKEFYENRWMSFKFASKTTRDNNTIKAIKFIENNLV